MSEINKSSILIYDRASIKLTGVEGITSLNETEASILICGDKLNIKGENLKADKLSVETGELLIVGKINCLKYEEIHEKRSFLKKILK
ncbi:MAG: hypothetical protein J6T74_03995 [Clostridia bacterium]|nr:hypothetical protein [Clostridia bacterium]